MRTIDGTHRAVTTQWLKHVEAQETWDKNHLPVSTSTSWCRVCVRIRFPWSPKSPMRPRSFTVHNRHETFVKLRGGAGMGMLGAQVHPSCADIQDTSVLISQFQSSAVTL